MNQSFFNAAIGAGSQQRRLDVLANNIANVNTTGFKTKNPVFAELMSYNMKGKADPANRLQTGSGVKVNKVDTNYANNAIIPSTGAYDYGISGDGFFMLQDPVSGGISYTRDGNFSLSQRGNQFFLATSTGKLVLDRNGNPIQVTENSTAALDIGIFDFANKNGMMNVGDNEFVPINKNGQPFLAQNSKLQQGVLEMSNVDFANEITKVIEAQRAYSYALKMVQTSDEIESTINSLRQ